MRRQAADALYWRGALMHADAAQSVGKVAVDVNELGVDLLSIAGHKLYAPKGVGALFVLSLDIILGYAGIVSLGHAAFFGIGAYTAGLFSKFVWRTPAAGVPQEESGDIFELAASLSDDLTLLFIEHDMHVVFRFATHIIVLVGGGVFTEGSPAEVIDMLRLVIEMHRHSKFPGVDPHYVGGFAQLTTVSGRN